MSFKHTVDFVVKWQRNYNQKKKKTLYVEELGRHRFGFAVSIESWSKKSNDVIPDACKIRFVDPPSSLPLSLKLGPVNKLSANLHEVYFIDATNPSYNNFKIKTPARPMPEFLPKTFSIGRNLLWALREKVDVSHIDFFVSSHVLRTIALSAYFRKSSWSFAIIYYKNKMFIGDGKMKENDKYWLRGYDQPDFRFHKEVYDPADFSADSGDQQGPDSSRATDYFIEFPKGFSRNRKLLGYGRVFDILMKNGDSDPSKIIGDDMSFGEVRCAKYLKLGNNTLLTCTRISCQEPYGEIDTQENYVEIKSKFKMSEEKFAKYESFKLWSHCALVGVNSVYCGFRDIKGNLTEIRKYTLEELVEIGQNYWNPNDILTFLENVLCWLKQRMNMSCTRERQGEKWLKEKLSSEDISSFSMTFEGRGIIKLFPDDHPEFQKVIRDHYDCLEASAASDISISGNSDDVNVPDRWDDSD